MNSAERLEAGFPVEVAIFNADRIKSRPGVGSDRIYAFTLAPDTTNDGIFCDAPGERPGSIAWGMTLDPVLLDPSPVYDACALYVETTGPELLHLIACLQDLYNVNYNAQGQPTRDEDSCYGIHNFVTDKGGDPIEGSAHCTQCGCARVDPVKEV